MSLFCEGCPKRGTCQTEPVDVVSLRVSFMSKLDSFNGFLAAAVDAQGGVSETLKLPPSADRKGLLRFVDARITACTAISPDTTAEQHVDEGCAVFSDSQIQDRTLSQYYTEKLIVAAHDLSNPTQH